MNFCGIWFYFDPFDFEIVIIDQGRRVGKAFLIAYVLETIMNVFVVISKSYV